ncbi:MAG TPA: hypothetical protein VMS76_05520 [Planctomycetota bacterium]|nr:hypothetical protein [Planctomycetota bacterium]
MPTFGYAGIESSQATRFSSEFNPAFSFVVDAVGDYVHFSGRSDDGFDADLRGFELGGMAWVDPKAWAYFIGAMEDEQLAIEEAVLHYVGFEENSTLRAGRFFIDFGKQMQVHVHELRTVERPLVLRAYLGEEVKGDGIQWDDWRPVGEKTAVRWSIGAFSSLLPEEDEFLPDPAKAVDERKDIQDFNFTARVTGFTDLSDNAILQLGASARVVPDYSVEFEATGDTEEGLENTVWGLDVTYGWVDDTGQRRWTLGAEYLLNTGDTGADNPAPGTVDVLDDTVGGYYAFVDYAWSRYNSVGLQFSAVELPDLAESDLSETEIYFTHSFSEFQRLRLGLAAIDTEDEDAFRVAIQYTAVLGAHGHGINW